MYCVLYTLETACNVAYVRTACNQLKRRDTWYSVRPEAQ